MSHGVCEENSLQLAKLCKVYSAGCWDYRNLSINYRNRCPKCLEHLNGKNNTDNYIIITIIIITKILKAIYLHQQHIITIVISKFCQAADVTEQWLVLMWELKHAAKNCTTFIRWAPFFLEPAEEMLDQSWFTCTRLTWNECTQLIVKQRHY